MAHPAPSPDTDTKDDALGQPSNPSPAPNRPPSPSPQPTAESPDPKKLGPDTTKRTKHTRVHKREKELCGLVTPIFLPLLDAGTSPTKKKKEKRRPAEDQGAAAVDSPAIAEHGPPSRDAEDGSMDHREGVETAEASKENQKESKKSDAAKKSKRAAVKKSSLRHNNTPRPRRKRVSLVIDDQIVLPADSIPDPPLTSPTETTASTTSSSNSTTSLDDSIDPRLVSPYETPAPSQDAQHHGPVHHSLDLPTPLSSTSPIKHASHPISDSPPLQDESSQTVTRAPLDSSPPRQDTVPPYTPRSPIYANPPDSVQADEEDFSTYVGGLSGSGVDDVDQVGSYGYPSSLGASYLESYMKSRPLSVRVASAERAGLAEDEKRALINVDDDVKEDDIDLDFGRVDDADQSMEIMGDMEGF